MTFTYRTAAVSSAAALLLLVIWYSSEAPEPQTEGHAILRAEARQSSGIRRARISNDVRIREKIYQLRKEMPLAEQKLRLGEMAWETIHQSPQHALIAIRELPEQSEERLSMIQVCAQNLFRDFGFTKTMAWISSLSDKEGKLAVTEVAVLLAETNPPRALALLADDDSVLAVDSMTLETILHRWTMKSPSKAADWVTALPTTESRAMGYQAVFAQWIQTDHEAARHWINAQKDPANQRQATRILDDVVSNWQRSAMEDSQEGSPPLSIR